MEFKIVLHFRVVLRLWKCLSYVCGGVYIAVCGRFTLVGGFTFDGVTALKDTSKHVSGTFKTFNVEIHGHLLERLPLTEKCL